MPFKRYVHSPGPNNKMICNSGRNICFCCDVKVIPVVILEVSVVPLCSVSDLSPTI